MIFKQPTHFALFKQRRKQFIENIIQRYGQTKGAVLVAAGFELDRYVFRQESSFYYLTGLTEPAAILLMYLDGREVLFIPKYSLARSAWMNVAVSGPEDAHKFLFDEIRYLGKENPGYSFKPFFTSEKYENLLNELDAFIVAGTKVFSLLSKENESYMLQLALFEKMQSWLPVLTSCSLDVSAILHEMRRVKDQYETDLIYKAVQITNMAHTAAAQFIVENKYEYEVQAALECVFTSVAGATPSFPSIVASGKNSTVLHYTEKNGVLKNGDLVVVDIGAEYGMYAADLSRTYPVSGKFTSRQLQIYTAVLETQLYIESIAQPGMYLKNAQHKDKSLHHLAVDFLAQKGLSHYFSHGIGHYLGLDVHDVGDYSKPLQAGDVFTIEPGVYIPDEALGVRIEDDYVMADDGAFCLSYELPKQPDEIEELMASQQQKELAV